MLTLWAIDPTGTPRGTLDPLEAKAVLRHNQQGTWLFTLPLEADPLTQRLEPGWSILATDPTLRISGAIQGFHTEATSQGLTLTINGKTELHRLADRIIYPNPTRQPHQQDKARWDAKGPAETIIKELTRLNAGPDALRARRSPAFTVEPTQGRGKVVTVSERFSNLLEVCQQVAEQAGLCFDAVREDTGQVVLRVWESRDLTRRVRLEATGEVKTEAPTGTAVIVAGQGEGEARTLREYTRSAGAWGHRVETFKDRRDTNETAALAQAGEEALAETSERNSASFDLAEEDDRFGEAFTLGDQVTINLQKAEITEQITSATITWKQIGREITLGVGPEAEANKPTWSPKINDLSTRLRRLETR